MASLRDSADERRYAVLAFDFRGYGQSMGTKDPAAYPKDVEGALDILRVFGVVKMTVIGSEVGGTASVAIPQSSAQGVQGIVTLGSQSKFENLDVRDEARALKIKALVLEVGGAKSDLGGLIPDAEAASVTATDQPEIDSATTSKIAAFISDATG